MLGALLTIASVSGPYLFEGATQGRETRQLGVSANHLCSVTDLDLSHHEACQLRVPGDGSWLLDAEGHSETFRCGATCVLMDEQDEVGYHPDRVWTTGSVNRTKHHHLVISFLGGQTECDASTTNGGFDFRGNCSWYVLERATRAYLDINPPRRWDGTYDISDWSGLLLLGGGYYAPGGRQYATNDTATGSPWAIRFVNCSPGCNGLCVEGNTCQCDDEHGGHQCQCYASDMLPGNVTGYCTSPDEFPDTVIPCQCDSECFKKNVAYMKCVPLTPQHNVSRPVHVDQHKGTHDKKYILYVMIMIVLWVIIISVMCYKKCRVRRASTRPGTAYTELHS